MMNSIQGHQSRNYWQSTSENNVMDIEGKIIEFDEFRLVGIGDLWAGKANMRFYLSCYRISRG